MILIMVMIIEWSGKPRGKATRRDGLWCEYLRWNHRGTRHPVDVCQDGGCGNNRADTSNIKDPRAQKNTPSVTEKVTDETSAVIHVE